MRWIRAIITGGVAALALTIVIGSILSLYDAPSEPRLAFERAAWSTLRLSISLVLFGGVFGAVFLHRWPPSWPRLLLVGFLSLLVTVTSLLAVRAWQDRRWDERVVRAEVLV